MILASPIQQPRNRSQVKLGGVFSVPVNTPGIAEGELNKFTKVFRSSPYPPVVEQNLHMYV